MFFPHLTLLTRDVQLSIIPGKTPPSPACYPSFSIFTWLANTPPEYFNHSRVPFPPMTRTSPRGSMINSCPSRIVQSPIGSRLCFRTPCQSSSFTKAPVNPELITVLCATFCPCGRIWQVCPSQSSQSRGEQSAKLKGINKPHGPSRREVDTTSRASAVHHPPVVIHHPNKLARSSTH